MAVHKLHQTPTDGKTAYIINKVCRELKKLRELISEGYKTELMEPYAKRDEKGEYNPDIWEPVEEKKEEFEKLQKEFGLREYTLLRPRLVFNDIRNVKLSPKELDALEPVLDESTFEKPEAPVTSMSVAR